GSGTVPDSVPDLGSGTVPGLGSGTVPDFGPGPGLGSGGGGAGAGAGRGPIPGELAARALRAHSTLAQGLGRSIPVTGLELGGGPRALAAFLAVYAAQHTHRTPAPHTAP
ncbi:hypothetical protein ABT159_43105, partial [Streptomyces sp. NPDC001642]